MMSKAGSAIIFYFFKKKINHPKPLVDVHKATVLADGFGKISSLAKLICFLVALCFLVLGELGNDLAERMLKGIDPMNLNQVILAEGKQVEHSKREYSKKRI